MSFICEKAWEGNEIKNSVYKLKLMILRTSVCVCKIYFLSFINSTGISKILCWYAQFRMCFLFTVQKNEGWTSWSASDGCKKVDKLDLVIIKVQLSHTSNIMVNKPTHA